MLITVFCLINNAFKKSTKPHSSHYSCQSRGCSADIYMDYVLKASDRSYWRVVCNCCHSRSITVCLYSAIVQVKKCEHFHGVVFGITVSPSCYMILRTGWYSYLPPYSCTYRQCIDKMSNSRVHNTDKSTNILGPDFWRTMQQYKHQQPTSKASAYHIHSWHVLGFSQYPLLCLGLCD